MADVVHRNPDNSEVTLKSRVVSGKEVLARDVESLPGTVQTDIAAMKAALDELAAAITSNRLAVDLATTPLANLATLAGAITAARMQVDLAATPLANLATIAAAITAARMQVDLAATPTANLATLAAAITAARMQVDLAATPTANLASMASTLTSILDAVAGASAGAKIGYKSSIGTGADVSFDSQVLANGMYIKNVSAIPQVIYYSHAATPSSTTAYPLMPGEVSPWVRCTNANAIKMRSSDATGIAVYNGD